MATPYLHSTQFTIIPESLWTKWESSHHQYCAELLAGYKKTRDSGRIHPIFHFLFTYYRASPGKLATWSPGMGYLLENAHLSRSYLRTPSRWNGYSLHTQDGVTGLVVDLDVVNPHIPQRLAKILHKCALMQQRPTYTGCFGLHEWAMVYQPDPNESPHQPAPFRLDAERREEIVRTLGLRCTHFDAFRFFTRAAEPHNHQFLTSANGLEFDQPGCTHATMDSYRWCYELAPLISSNLLMNAFDIARDARIVDMQGSPYDVQDWGINPILIETSEGRTEFAEQQQRLAARAGRIRQSLPHAIEPAAAYWNLSLSNTPR